MLQKNDYAKWKPSSWVSLLSFAINTLCAAKEMIEKKKKRSQENSSKLSSPNEKLSLKEDPWVRVTHTEYLKSFP